MINSWLTSSGSSDLIGYEKTPFKRFALSAEVSRSAKLLGACVCRRWTHLNYVKKHDALVQGSRQGMCLIYPLTIPVTTYIAVLLARIDFCIDRDLLGGYNKKAWLDPPRLASVFIFSGWWKRVALRQPKRNSSHKGQSMIS